MKTLLFQFLHKDRERKRKYLKCVKEEKNMFAFRVKLIPATDREQEWYARKAAAEAGIR